MLCDGHATLVLQKIIGTPESSKMWLKTGVISVNLCLKTIIRYRFTQMNTDQGFLHNPGFV